MSLPTRSDRATTPDGRADTAPYHAEAGEGSADTRCPAGADGTHWKAGADGTHWKADADGTHWKADADGTLWNADADGVADADSDERPGPCATCSYRTRCIRFGWLSPRGHWFESHVVIAPLPGCRGHERSAGDIARRFVRA